MIPTPVALALTASSDAAGAVVPTPTFPAAVWYRFEFPIDDAPVQIGI
jgi:hypothetical protein